MSSPQHQDERARLHARPRANHPRPLTAGLHPLGLGHKRDGLISVPPGYHPDVTRPLLLLLHGAGANAACLLPTFQDQIDAAGLIVLAPDSRNATWDAILGDWGDDIAFLDAALAHVFSICAVQADRIAVGGFSDGASYALSLGLANGDLFEHVLAFSPGFMVPLTPRGAPHIFMSHGTRDDVLPIDRCSRPLRRILDRAGYDVSYHEFDGAHRVPPTIIGEAFQWWLDGV